MKRNLMVMTLLLGLAGCTIFGPAGDAPDVFEGLPAEYEGVVSFGFEVSLFQPCGIDEGWWVRRDESGRLQAGYAERAEKPYDRVYARVVGIPGPRGRYGHTGAYEREFDVIEVLEMRKEVPPSCQ
ncbi:MAG: hypothetical protein KatS3mg044_0230 [Rhodothermaceae bacterium]|nr:MAG: hypothetical protein KatS3mg044_0230 [Rhodothermaceae bacterium]